MTKAMIEPSYKWKMKETFAAFSLRLWAAVLAGDFGVPAIKADKEAENEGFGEGLGLFPKVEKDASYGMADSVGPDIAEGASPINRTAEGAETRISLGRRFHISDAMLNFLLAFGFGVERDPISKSVSGLYPIKDVDFSSPDFWNSFALFAVQNRLEFDDVAFILDFSAKVGNIVKLEADLGAVAHFPGYSWVKLSIKPVYFRDPYGWEENGIVFNIEIPFSWLNAL